jgi:hypothetical protein
MAPAPGPRLRAALIREAERRHPLATQRRRVSGREWKSLINDWYDGHIDGWYRCAVVRAAVAHLPGDLTAGTISDDLRSYARAVCPA